MSLPLYDLGIPENYNNVTAYEHLISDKEVIKYYENTNNKLYDLYYTPSFESEKLPFLTFPMHLTIKNELEAEGLNIVSCEKEVISDMTLLTFEIDSTDKNIEDIEYNIIKKHNLNKKNITLTIY